MKNLMITLLLAATIGVSADAYFVEGVYVGGSSSNNEEYVYCEDEFAYEDDTYEVGYDDDTVIYGWYEAEYVATEVYCYEEFFYDENDMEYGCEDGVIILEEVW